MFPEVIQECGNEKAGPFQKQPKRFQLELVRLGKSGNLLKIVGHSSEQI